MALTSEAVIHLARMARFEVLPEEVERFRVQLNAVLERIAELQQVADAATAIAAQEPVRLRDDVVSAEPLRGGVEQLSADVVAGFFTVPQALPVEGATP